MGRSFVPTALLDARGGFETHPERKRARADEPKPTGPLGPAPRSFDPDQKKIWRELHTIIPPGVLTNADRWTVEIACVLMAKQRKGTITSPERSQLIQMLGRMAMTPADRAKVGVFRGKGKDNGKATPADPWAEFEQPVVQ